jgi:hypothetical protein
VLFLLLHKPAKPAAALTVPIEIRTDPPGAAVHLGDRSCTTPNCQFDVAPGDYRLDAQLPGYAGQQQTITANASQRVYTLSLAPLPPPASQPNPASPATGSVVVQAGVPDATVSVDGTARSHTDQYGYVTLPLDAGKHEVRVEKNGYEKAVREIAVASGSQLTETFRLKPQLARLQVDGAPPGVDIHIGGASLGVTDGSQSFVFPAPIAPGDQFLEVTMGSGKRTVQQHFDAGQTQRLRWDAIAPAS